MTMYYRQQTKHFYHHTSIDRSISTNRECFMTPQSRPNLQEEFDDTKSESVNRKRTDNTMAKRKRTKGQKTIYKTYTSN
jgi:hypothetical protein